MPSKKILTQIILILLVSCLLRFLGGEFREGFIDERKYTGLRFITLAEAEDLFAQKIQLGEGAVFIDSRGRQDFAAGHIPGALSVPLAEWKGQGERASDGALSEALSFPQDQVLVVYCEGGDCQTSITLARLIHERGFTDIRILSGGWEEWIAAGLPVERSP
jgi:rhodanese-related sulfurtransferase